MFHYEGLIGACFHFYFKKRKKKERKVRKDERKEASNFFFTVVNNTLGKKKKKKKTQQVLIKPSDGVRTLQEPLLRLSAALILRTLADVFFPPPS